MLLVPLVRGPRVSRLRLLLLLRLRLLPMLLLLLPPLAASSASAAPLTPPAIASTAQSHDPTAQSRDPRIQRALDWLPAPPAVPIEVVEVDRLAARLAREVRTACAFVIRGVPRIYVSSRCPVYRRAEYNPLDAIGLAAVIGHEMAHLAGADEVRARQVEEALVRSLSTTLPGEYRVRVAIYIADLQRRRHHESGPADSKSDPTGNEIIGDAAAAQKP